MPEERIPIGEEGLDEETGRKVWWDGRGWSYRPPLVPVSREGRIPLSFSQSRLWFLHQMKGSSTEYNLCEAMRLKGSLDVAALANAIDALVARHESLRTVFLECDGEPYQQVLSDLQIKLQVTDLSGLSDAVRQNVVDHAIRQEGIEGFDLQRGPLIRVRLLRLSEYEHIFIRCCHHIVSDGWSAAILNEETAILYDAFLSGKGNTLPPLPIQYPDFAVWQRACLDAETLRQGIDYWKARLSGVPERLNLPLDHPRPALQTHSGAACLVSLNESRLKQLRSWCRVHGATEYMTLLAVLGVLLERYSGQHDIVVGSAVANRADTALEGLVGFFVNTLAMRMRVFPRSSFRELLDSVRATTLDSYRHRNIPFERLVEELAPNRTLDSTPLFQVVFVLQNSPVSMQKMPGLVVRPEGGAHFQVRFDIELHGFETDRELELVWVYNRDLFDHWRIEQLSRHFLQLLESVMAFPDLPIYRLPMLDRNERSMLTADSGPLKSRADTLTAQFEAQVERAPDAPAITFGEDTLSYGELNRRANRVAHRLIRAGVEPETLVGVHLERSLDLIVAILGVLKAGGAYVPLDTEYPAARLEFMIRDAQPGLVIDAQWLSESCNDAMDRNPSDIDRKKPVSASNAAYVIYTSGSTGTPKGCVVTHENVTRLFEATRYWFDFDANDVWTFFHSCAFDFSVWELWGALLYGGRLVVVPRMTARSPDDFLALLVRERVTVLNQTPSAFYQLGVADEENPAAGANLSLRYVIFGGEALELSRLDRWYRRHNERRPELVNMYGITETTVHVSYAPLDREKAAAARGSIIGSNIPDLRVYLLDDYLEPVPIGVVGEMYVAGPGLARGYLNRKALTSARFIANPYGPPGSRMYRSGDLAMWSRPGELEYLGRSDQQVKVRGFRIEPGEIEAVLLARPGVAHAAVVLRQDGDLSQLVAYVVPRNEAELVSPQLRESLRNELPDYMVPDAVIEIEALPLTPSGKLDRSALPAPRLTGRGNCADEKPTTPIERAVAEVWESVLGVESIGLDDNVFHLGTNSMLVVKIVSQLRKVIAPKLGIIDVFQFPRVRLLVRRIEELNSEPRTHEVPEPSQAAIRAQHGKLASARALAVRTAAVERDWRRPGADGRV